MTCSRCKKQKILWAFATFKSRSGEPRRRGVCKDCRGINAKNKFAAYQEYRREYNKRNRGKKKSKDAIRRAKAKAYVNAIKERTACADCHRKFPAVCMDFDHIKAKVRSVANLVGGAYRIELIKEEMSRCELVCANCHRIRTKKRKQNLAKVLSPWRPSKLSDKHIVSMRVDRAIGEPVAHIAKRYGVSVGYAYQILSGERRTGESV